MIITIFICMTKDVYPDLIVTNHNSSTQPIMNRPPTPYFRDDDASSDDDTASLRTTSDYETAWTIYRNQYLSTEILIRRAAREIFHRLTRHQQNEVILIYGAALNQVVELLAYEQGTHRMYSEGWGHISIAPVHRHVSRLPEDTIRPYQNTGTAYLDPHHPR